MIPKISRAIDGILLFIALSAAALLAFILVGILLILLSGGVPL